MRIYIAAPLFNEGERAFNEKIDAILRECGHETFLPQREGGCVADLPDEIEGMPKRKTFRMGVLSGAVEPIAAVVTMLAAGLVTPVMPYFLAFAAGAMMYVVVEELIPEMSEGKHSNIGTVAFALGFVCLMILDVALG